MFMAKKTTILLREDVYQFLKQRVGAKNISNEINKILVDYFVKKESMFGVMRKIDVKDLRDHRERL
jgi:hypothetical protein